MSRCPSRSIRRTVGAAVLALFAASLCSCVPGALRGDSSPELQPVLHPQASVASGQVWLQPRHARQARPLTVPLLLDPDDWIETGADGKVELQLPQATLRLYANTRVQVPFRFEKRAAVATVVRVESGELLVARVGDGPYAAKTPSLEVALPPGTIALVGTRDQLHKVACQQGAVEGRQVRVRGQTVIRVGAGQVLTVDDTQTLAFLEDLGRPAEWLLWEEAGVFTSGLVPPPQPTPDTTPGK